MYMYIFTCISLDMVDLFILTEEQKLYLMAMRV